MIIVDESGKYAVLDGSLQPKTSNHPVYQARVALGLPLGEWLFAPDQGHSFARFKKAKASQTNFSEFQKSLKLYLAPFGPQVVDVFTSRGVITESLQIAQGALTNG